MELIESTQYCDRASPKRLRGNSGLINAQAGVKITSPEGFFKTKNMWQIIDKDAYIKSRNKQQKVFEGYTDVDGTCPLGNGSPYMETVWGNPATDLPEVKIIMTKQSVSQEEWDYEYFKFIESQSTNNKEEVV